MISDAIEELKIEVAKVGGRVGPASAEELGQARAAGLPPTLLAFYAESAPGAAEGMIELKQRIWSVRRTIEENLDYVPGAYVFPLGYVVFASNTYGDAYCIDTTQKSASGEEPIVLLPHDGIEEETAAEDVTRCRLTIAENLEGFLKLFVRRALPEEPKYD